MKATYFLTRTLAKVETELSFYVLAYYVMRMIQVFGVKPLIAVIRA